MYISSGCQKVVFSGGLAAKSSLLPARRVGTDDMTPCDGNLIGLHFSHGGPDAPGRRILVNR